MTPKKSTSVFLDIVKFADTHEKNTEVRRNQEVCQVIHIFLESSLGKASPL